MRREARGCAVARSHVSHSSAIGATTASRSGAGARARRVTRSSCTLAPRPLSCRVPACAPVARVPACAAPWLATGAPGVSRARCRARPRSRPAAAAATSRSRSERAAAGARRLTVSGQVTRRAARPRHVQRSRPVPPRRVAGRRRREISQSAPRAKCLVRCRGRCQAANVGGA